jgi:DNA-binding response OmpR family regulator
MEHKKQHVLLIDDNPLLIELYQSALEKSGYQVSVAHDGEEGLRFAMEQVPDAIVLDIVMPGEKDGFKVLELLRSDEQTKMIKVIVLSAVTDPKQIERIKELGAVEYLIKHECSVEELVAHIAAHLAGGE